MSDQHELVESNRRLWEGWTGLHVDSSFYDVDGFVADPASRPLDSIVRDVVGDVTGERLLHLQCHFGLDTLRFAMMGAAATGVDFSAEAVSAATSLAETMGVDATFVESDVRHLPQSVPCGGFDVVFTSYGVISWLPELEEWAETIASRLAPGGRFCIVEMHPTLWMFDEEEPEPPLALKYSYFSREVLTLEEKGSYAVPDADFEGTSHSWQHTFEEIIGALVGKGLVIESLREYPRISWRHVPWMVADSEGLWRLPSGAGDVPLMFSLVARKPG